MSLELNVENLDAIRYSLFIRQLRSLLRTSTESLGVPHLVPEITNTIELIRASQRDISTVFLNFTLRTDHHQVTFRIRRDNVYLVGYRNESEVWREFGHDNQNSDHLIPDSSFLGFGGSYDDMEGRGGRVEGVAISFSSLVSAVNELATTTNNQIRARRLIVVVMMFCEATRLNPIFSEVSNGNATITGRMMDWVRNWGNLSAQVCLYNANSSSNMLRDSNLRDETEFQTVFHAAYRLGLIKDYRYWPNGSMIERRSLLQAVDGDDQPYNFEGLPLVEIFPVRIDKSDENESEIYGTITVNDGLTQSIYNRQSSKYEAVKKGRDVTLTGPEQSIWATRGFTIYCHLKDEDGWWNADDEIVDDSFSWDAFAVNNMSKYDQRLSQQLRGKKGSATLNYAVLRNAVEAGVTITINEGGEGTVQVYGKDTANYSDWTDPTATSVLFNRPVEHYVDVKRGRDLPLLRSVVAVPMGSSLKITASLRDYDEVSRDDEIVNGFVEFPAKTSGQSTKELHGRDRHWVTMTVHWGEPYIAPQGDSGYSPRPTHDDH